MARMISQPVPQYCTLVSHYIFSSAERVLLVLALAGSDTVSYALLPSVFLTYSSSTDCLRNYFFHIGSCAVSRGADTRTGRARSCDRNWPAPYI
jgi:hypothetical protein